MTRYDSIAQAREDISDAHRELISTLAQAARKRLEPLDIQALRLDPYNGDVNDSKVKMDDGWRSVTIADPGLPESVLDAVDDFDDVLGSFGFLAPIIRDIKMVEMCYLTNGYLEA